MNPKILIDKVEISNGTEILTYFKIETKWYCRYEGSLEELEHFSGERRTIEKLEKIIDSQEMLCVICKKLILKKEDGIHFNFSNSGVHKICIPKGIEETKIFLGLIDNG